MARSDDDGAGIALLAIGAYFLYQYFKQHGFNFSFGGGGGAPGPLPFGAGGSGTGTGTGAQGPLDTGTGNLPAAPSTLPSAAGSAAGMPVCINDTTGAVDAFNADGSCPAGSTLTLAVNVTQ